MARSFEDLECWQLAVELDKNVFDWMMRSGLNKDFSLRDQMLRSSGSIADNIAEGFERGGNREMIQFLSIAKGSCGELRSQFHRCKARGVIEQEEFENFVRRAVTVSTKIANLMGYLKTTEMKGPKYK